MLENPPNWLLTTATIAASLFLAWWIGLALCAGWGLAMLLWPI